MVRCVAVEKTAAQEAISALKRWECLDPAYRVTRVGNLVHIPIKEECVGRLDELLTEASFALVECNPPRREGKPLLELPSYDLVGNVALIRAKVLEVYGEDVVNSLLRAHPKLIAVYAIEETAGEFRLPRLKLLWGQPVHQAIAREYGITFRVPLGKAYYNPRLSEEHRRVAEVAKDGEFVVDLFSGIGGFAIHIACLRDAFVLANDANPVAYMYIAINVRENRKRLRGNVYPTNMDARVLGELLDEESADRLIANLPRNSLEFCDVYNKVLAKGGHLHLYVLSYDIETTIERVKAQLSSFEVRGYRLVLEHSPRAGIYRIDLVKR